nr:MAK10-like protein [Tanacetum cinerariifolium]
MITAPSLAYTTLQRLGTLPRVELRFALAFWSLRFGSAFWFCVLLIEYISCVLPNEEPVLGYLKFSAKGTKRDVFGKPVPAGEQGSDPDSPAPKPTKATKKSKLSVPKVYLRPPVTKSTSFQQHEPKPAQAKSQGKKRKLVTEISDKPYPARKSRPGLVSKRRKPIISLRLVDESVAKGIPEKEPRVDDEEADLPEVHGKGKNKVTNKQVARDLLTLQTPKKKSHVDQFIFQRCTSTLTGSYGHDKSLSLYTELRLTDSEVESDEDAPGIDTGVPNKDQARPNPCYQDEGQAGSNLDEQDKGQAGPNPSDAATSQPLPSPIVYARPNLEHMDLEVTDVSTQAQPKQMDEGFTIMAYPKVEENLKLMVEEQVILEEPASSTGTLSSLQHLTKDLIFGDLFFNDKPSEADNKKTTIETKGESMVSVTIQQDTSLIPPMKTLIIDLTLRPESLNVHQLLQATATKTTTTIHPPPSQPQQRTIDSMLMKRIGELKHIMANLIQDNKHLEERLDSHGARLYILENLDIPQQETNSYKTHKDHMMLYEALEKSMNRYHSEELLKDLAEAHKKNKKRHDSPKTPPGSPPHQPPPPPLPAGPSGASGSLGAFGSSQVLPLPSPPPSTNQEAPDAEAQSSDDEDIGNAHIPKNNWASALASTYSPPLEDSLLAQTSDMTMFMDWFCKRQGITKLKPQDLEGPAFELVNHPNVTIQSDFFFNKDLEYLRYDSKGSRPALLISKMKAAYYPDVGLEQMVPDQMWIKEECKYDITTIDFEDLHLLNLQGHLKHLPPKAKKILTTAVNLWTRHLVIRQRVKDFMLGIKSYQTQLNLTKPRWDATGFEYKYDYTEIDSPRAIDEALDYRVKEFKVTRMNLGLNTRFWTRKDVDRSKEFMFAIQKRLKTKRIFRNLESFVAVCSSLRSLKPKHTIESRAKRSSKIISLGHYSIILASSHIVKRDENPIRTLGDYSKPSHKGYKNTIELYIGNNVVPLRSDIIWLVQNGCSFHEFRSDDPNQHLKLAISLNVFQQEPSPHGRILLLVSLLKDPKQAFVEYASSHTDEAGGSINTIKIYSEKLSESYEEKAKENEEEEKDSLENIHVNSSLPPDPSAAFNTKKGDDEEVMFIELIRKNDDSSKGEPEEEGSTTTKEVGSEYFDIFPTRSELAYHKYLICSLIPLIFLRNPIIMEGFLSNLKIPCNIGLDPKENSNRRVSNFTRRIKGRHVFIGNFTYIVRFMIGKDISSIIDPRLSQVVLGKPFVEISNMTHDPPEGVVRFTNRTDEVAYKMPHMIK